MVLPPIHPRRLMGSSSFPIALLQVTTLSTFVLFLSITASVSSIQAQVETPHHGLHQYVSVPATPRKLAVGDFAILNEVFADLELAIEVADPIAIDAGIVGTITVDLANLVCKGIKIDDLLIAYEQSSETSISYDLDVIQFDIECAFDYEYRAPLGLNGEGSATVETNDNFFNADLFLSQVSTDIPPDALEISNCVPGIEIINIDFQGGVVAFILNIIEPILRNTIENKVEEFVCEYVAGLKDRGEEFLDTISDLVVPYLEPVDAVDPLGPEIEFNATLDPTATKLVNFQDPTGAISVSIDTLLKEASRILGRDQSDRNSPTGTGRDLGVNVLMRDFLLDDDRAFNLNTTGGFLNNGVLLNTTAGTIADVEIIIEHVKLKGVDTFTRFDPFDEIGSYTLQGSFAWNYTIIEVDIYIALGPPGSNEKIEERIKISTRVDDLEFSFAALLGVNEDSLGALKIGDILDSSEILPCLFSTIEVVEISSLILSVGAIEDPVIQDFESPGLARLIETAFNGLYELLDDLIIVAIPGLFQTTLKDLLNEEIAKLRDGSKCNPVEPSSDSAFIDFRDLLLPPSTAKNMGASGSELYGDIGSLLRSVVDDLMIAVNPKTGRPKINEEIIAPLTAFQSGSDGVLELNATLFSVKSGLNLGSLVADIKIEAYNARLENLDTVSNPLVLIEPTARSAYKLDNDVVFGLTERPLRGSARLLIAIQGDDINIRDEIDISLNLVEARATIALLAKLVTSRFLSFPFRDLTNIQCWLASIPAPALDPQGIRLGGVERTAGLAEVVILFQNLFLNVTCIDCTSPSMYELSELLATEEAMEGTTDAANRLLDYATTLLDGEFIQIFLDRLITSAPSQCPNNPAYDPNFQALEYEPFEEVEPPGDSAIFLLVVGLSIIGAVLIFAVVSFIVRRFVRRRNVKWLSTLPSPTVFRIYREQKRENEEATYLRETTASMFSSKDIPLLVRYLIPIIVVGNIVLFLSGHLSIGGSVSVYIQFAGEDVVIEDIFTFSVAGSVTQLYNAGGWQLALLILLFSGVWPYTKQLVTLVAWFIPPRRLSVGRRGSILIWLDVLAKWSSADIFFLIVSLTAFNISIESPNISYLPEDFYSVNILLTPLWGLYANLIAQLLSQLSSHVIIYYHRKLVEKAVNCQGHEALPVTNRDENGTELANQSSILPERLYERLYEHGFLRVHRGNKATLTIRRGINTMLMGTSVVVLALIVAGCIIPSYSFEQLGLLGVVVEVGRQSDIATNEFSVFGIAKTLIDQGRFLGTAKSQIGLAVIAMLMILTIVVVPLVQIGALLYQWLGNVGEKRRRQLEVFTEILSSWQYVEVYLLAIIISVWQLGPTSEYLINSFCGDLKDKFSSLVFFGILEEEDAQCFRLKGFIDAGCFILLGAAFLLAFLNTCVTRAVLQYQRDKTEEHRQENECRDPDATTQYFVATMEVEEAMKKIHPTPVLFTDTFRWLLDSTSVPASTLHDIPSGSAEQVTADRSSRGLVPGGVVGTKEASSVEGSFDD